MNASRWFNPISAIIFRPNPVLMSAPRLLSTDKKEPQLGLDRQEDKEPRQGSSSRTRHPERGVNVVYLIGRVGRDAETRGSFEKPAVLFPLATTQFFRNAEGAFEQKTQWHKVVVFRPGLREIVARSVRKGDKVHVTGSINYSQYSVAGEQESDTQKVQATSIIADEVINLSWGSNYRSDDSTEQRQSLNEGQSKANLKTSSKAK